MLIGVVRSSVLILFCHFRYDYWRVVNVPVEGLISQAPWAKFNCWRCQLITPFIAVPVMTGPSVLTDQHRWARCQVHWRPPEAHFRFCFKQRWSIFDQDLRIGHLRAFAQFWYIWILWETEALSDWNETTRPRGISDISHFGKALSFRIAVFRLGGRALRRRLLLGLDAGGGAHGAFVYCLSWNHQSRLGRCFNSDPPTFYLFIILELLAF